jgi:hypothetical protein
LLSFLKYMGKMVGAAAKIVDKRRPVTQYYFKLDFLTSFWSVFYRVQHSLYSLGQPIPGSGKHFQVFSRNHLESGSEFVIVNLNYSVP